MYVEIECGIARAEEAILQHRREVTGVEGDFFKNANYERRQNGQWDDRLGKNGREIRDRQRFPKQDAAITPFAVKRIEAVEKADNKSGHDEHHRHNVVRQLYGGATTNLIQ